MQVTVPSNGIIRLYALGWVLIYLMLYFVFRDLIPEKFMRDATFLQEVLGNINSMAAQSRPDFVTVASIYNVLPIPLTNALIGVLDALILYQIVSSVRSFRGMGLLFIIVPPFIIQNLMAPTKETLVLLITSIILAIARRVRSDQQLLYTVIFIYGAYGGIMRAYYLLILLVFIAYYCILKTAPTLRWVYAVVFCMILVLLPAKVFIDTQGVRDLVNFWVGYGAPNLVRTAFNNPFPPDNALHFIGNYANAMLNLNVPFMFGFTSADLALCLNLLLYGWLTVSGISFLRGPLRLLPLLFLSHITIQMVFEPDSGSYFRHFSSLLLYLVPIWQFNEIRHSAALQHSYAARQFKQQSAVN